MRIKQKDKDKKKNNINLKIIERNTDFFYKMKNILPSKNKKNNYFSLHIVFKDECDSGMAEDLRKTFLNNGHIATKSDYSNYIQNVSEIPDYYLFINLSSEEEPESIQIEYEKYGCKIAVSDRRIFLNYDESYCENIDMVKFIDYYLNTVEKAKNKNENYNKIAKESPKFKKRASKDLTDPKLLNKLDELLNDFFEFLDTKDNMLAIPLMILSIPATFVVGISLLPIEITRFLVESTADELKNKDFNRKYYGKAQQHILEIKIIEYIEKLRMKQHIE